MNETMKTEKAIGLVVKPGWLTANATMPACFLVQITAPELAAWAAITKQARIFSEITMNPLPGVEKSLETLCFRKPFTAVYFVDDQRLLRVLDSMRESSVTTAVVKNEFVDRLLNDVELDVLETDVHRLVVHVHEKDLKLSCVNRGDNAFCESAMFSFQKLHDAFMEGE